ncbi:g1258 [Coccomyxa elongata]
MVRHPNVLALRDTLEIEEKGTTSIFIITEPVTPLIDVLEELELAGNAREEFVTMGLFHVAKAVGFLNNDCKLIHGNICMRAVVVTPSLDWRLHGFDLLSEHQPTTSIDWPLMHASWMVGAQYKPAELGKSDWQAVQQAPPWAVDAWGLGCLMQEVCSGHFLTRTEDLRNVASISKALLPDYQRLLASQPTRRLNTAKLADSAALRTKLVETISFMESLAVKDSNEKDMFFKRLPTVLPTLPLPVVQKKVLPMLASALEFGGAPAVALGALLQIGKSLDEDNFATQVVPALSKLFASNDRTIRRSLLESIDSYGSHFTQAVVEAQVYPHVATGFTDSNAYLRELTLKSMLVLAPKLSQKTLNQSLLKFLAKLQVDEEPGIRANTTILLGNLASHLSEAACKRVLLNAFTRALKDTFPPARIAGVRAMLATAQRHSPEEIALRAIPALGPLAVDPIAEVRNMSLQGLQTFTKILLDNARSLDETSTAASEGESTAGHSNSQAMGSSATWSGAGLGWAMSSIGLARSAGPVATGPIGGAPNSFSRTSAPSSEPTNLVVPAPSDHPPRAPETASGRPGGPTNSSEDAEGWGDDEEFGALEDPEEKEAQERLRRLNMRASTASRTDLANSSRTTLERQGSWDSESSLASSHSRASNMAPGPAADSGDGGAEQARKAHVSLPTRGRGSRGRGPRAATRVGTSSMKLRASKLGKTGDEFFEF